MAQRISETEWKRSLTSIMEELTEMEYKKMLFHLDKIPQGQKTDKIRVEMPQIIIQHYGTEKSITVMDRVIKEIPRMDAPVQDLLQRFVEKLKKQRQKKKEMAKKAAAESEASEPQPAAAQQKLCKPEKTEGVKAKPKTTEKQDPTLKPAGSTKTTKVAAAGTSAKTETAKSKQKATKKQVSTLEAARSTKTTNNAAGASAGTVKAKQKDPSLKPARSTKTIKDAAGASAGTVKAKQKTTKQQDSSLEPAEPTNDAAGASAKSKRAAAQSGTVKSATKKKGQ